MKVSQLKPRVIATLLVVCCLAGVGGQVAQAQSPPKFQTGDVFAGVGNGQINWYHNTGDGFTLVMTLSVGNANTFDTGMAFDAAGNLYATNFSIPSVSKFDTSGNLLGTFGAGYNTSPESIRFDSAGNAYVGQADGTHQILKFDSNGNPLAAFSPATEDRGTDWIELAADQKTIFYTSEGNSIKRFDTTGTGTQLPDFATGLPGLHAFALRILPNGNVLVANSTVALQLDTQGNIIHTYQPSASATSLFSLNLDPDGKHFWVGDLFTGTIWQIRIADAGTIVDQIINTGVTDQSFSVLGGVVVFGEITSSNSTNLPFSPSPTPQTQIGTIGNPTDPAAQSLALTLASVINPINVSVSFFYEPTDISTGTSGVGTADGVCESGATPATDFDCRLTAFTYQTFLNGDRLVPHIIPSHNNLGVWVRVIATRVSDGMPAVAGVDYTGPVEWYYAWNSNPSLLPGADPPNPEYSPGWNNQNPQMYDRPGENVDIAFVKNITTYSKFNCNPTCVGTADPGLGGRTPTLNDIVPGAPPNPPAGTADAVELLVPVPGSSPFIYLNGLPMLVTFELEKSGTEISDPTALTTPHSVNVATLDSNGNAIPIQFPKGAPTTFTFNKFFKVYSIFLSPAPYKLSDGTPNTVYTLQINSDLFPQPVNATFRVCTLSQVLNHACH
jgi:hypothetical protein